MKMPGSFDDDFYGIDRQNYPEGATPRIVAYSVVYPPVGFFPFAGIGNGDYYGYYWPLGKEDAPPLIAFSSHDAYELIPEYSDLLSAVKSQLAISEDGELEWGFLEALKVLKLSPADVDRPPKPATADHRAWLAIDPHSPFRHCAIGDQEIQSENFDQAVVHYRAAIEAVPSYAAAHFGLGYLYRRTRRLPDAAFHLRAALVSPMVFWGGSFWAEHHLPGTFRSDWPRKALLWLQQLKELPETLRDDPFLLRLKDLKLTAGEAANDDLPLLSQMVDEYVIRAQWTEAVDLWCNIRDRAAGETTSFRQRHGFTPRSFATRLAELLRRSGNSRRADLVESTLRAMRNPDGLHL